MEIIPAIDIRGGHAVRLFQGDYTKETVFSDSPVDVAQQWANSAPRRIHIVDLDGARDGKSTNRSIIQSICKRIDVPIQVGGGIRSLNTIRQYLEDGVQRVILGTVAIENPQLVQKACEIFGDAIIVGIDARNGFVATHGWLGNSLTEASSLISQMEKLGVQRFIYTDIGRDGTLEGPNLDELKMVIESATKPVIASGGVGSLSDLKILRKTQAEGVIIGQALYTDKISINDALAIASESAN
ncbi:MAG: 1-(5-phosphoribosyl)-5-[(5-phosphoribosylamino)methylideneamino]imidazole-4-carboxamide isomerase [SAR202 cluster bacterium]|nr:1-(5-phosphoribosyl)-5-[(5-phosphoribosylamino)methylideneamino]imidazole-4-carboxamide isomerase [SAR202 cluster bacterium]